MKNNLPLQAFILVAVVLISLSLTRINFGSNISEDGPTMALAGISEQVDSFLHFQRASFKFDRDDGSLPLRNWEVADPTVNSQAVMFQFFDEEHPVFYYNTYKLWPAASLTKLVSALVVLEDIGLNKKIFISQETSLKSGGLLKSGEVYTSRDLAKVMLISSNNGVAVAFEEHLGKEEFVRLMNQKARRIGMEQTVFFDGSGLSEENHTSARDITKLLKYIAEARPEILNWTRLSELIFRPINLNYADNKKVTSNNPFVNSSQFLGGKTGTLPRSGQNFAGIFTVDNRRVSLVVLGSENRVLEIERLIEWAREAYGL